MNLTLLLMTHERPKRLRRTLDYYSGKGLNIIIMDSSRRPFHPKKSDKVRYIHCPGKPYMKKASSALVFVQTKYAALIPDDDFQVPSGLRACVHFLDKHHDYSSCQGHYISFLKKANRVHFRPSYLYSIGKDVDATSASDRLEQQFNPYMHQYYSVHRTDNLRTVFDFPHFTTNLNTVEMLIATIGCIEGKHRVIPVFYSARELNPASAGYHMADFFSIRRSADGKKEYAAFVKYISGLLAKKDRLSYAKARKRVVSLLDAFEQRRKDHNKVKGFIHMRVMCPFVRECAEILLGDYRKLHTRGIDGFPFFDEGDDRREYEQIKRIVASHEV